VTLEVVVLSQLLAVAIALPLGALAAARIGGVLDRICTAGTFGLLAAPSFIVGVALVYVFAVYWHMFPASGYTPVGVDPIGNLRDMALPAATLALTAAPIYARVLRAAVAETLRQDHVVVARTRGVSSVRLLATHGVRPALGPFTVVLGLNLGALVGGAVVVEYLFGLPGLGNVFLNAIVGRDYLLAQACVTVFTVAYVLINFAVDVLQPVLEPRLRDLRTAP
jgi:peptide/nickel transport system permease protein